MTDKLICPFCDHKMVPYFGSKSVVVCTRRECPCVGHPLKTMFINKMHKQKADAQRATVLQKKLDKAMIGFGRIIEAYRRAGESWKVSCNDMYDVAIYTVKAIKDIEEA